MKNFLLSSDGQQFYINKTNYHLSPQTMEDKKK